MAHGGRTYDRRDRVFLLSKHDVNLCFPANQSHLHRRGIIWSQRTFDRHMTLPSTASYLLTLPSSIPVSLLRPFVRLSICLSVFVCLSGSRDCLHFVRWLVKPRFLNKSL